MKKRSLLFGLMMLGVSSTLSAQNVEVDVNFNIKHSVGGISDFGRDRHITLHASLSEPDCAGEEDNLNTY